VIRLFARLLPLLLIAHSLMAEAVLVLPFANPGGARNLDWIGDSLSELLIEVLSAEGVDVVRPQVRDEVLDELNLRRYAALTEASAMEAAINADASLVVVGDFAWTAAPPGKGQLRVTIRVIDIHGMRKLGDFTLDGPLEELSQLQAGLAWRTLRALRPQSAPDEGDFRRAHPPVRIDALEYYVRGLRAASPQQKHQMFATAARLAPAFSQPCFQLGRLNFFTLKHFGAAAEWFSKVRPTDSHYHEALFYLGLSRYHAGDFASAATPLRTLSEQVPLPEVLNNLGAVLLRLNDPAAADCFRKAIEADPAEAVYQFNLGNALWRRGEFAPAAEALQAALDRAPDDAPARLLLERCRRQQGPRPGDLRAEALERVQSDYNEAAWLALKSMLAPHR
jgi:tetratricopeptide (TPR) repeat protein